MRARGQRATTSRVTLLGAGRAERRAGDRHVDALEPVLGVACRLAASASLALDAHRPPLALPSGRERLREGADDRRHAHRGAPVAVVPLDAIAGRARTRRRPISGLDAVHEEEPVAPARRRPRPSARRSTGRSGRRSGSSRRTSSAACASPSRPRAASVEADGAELAVAEVARDAQVDGAALCASLAEPAARDRRREAGEHHGGCQRGLRTRLTAPRRARRTTARGHPCVATSRCAPAAAPAGPRPLGVRSSPVTPAGASPSRRRPATPVAARRRSRAPSRRRPPAAGCALSSSVRWQSPRADAVEPGDALPGAQPPAAERARRCRRRRPSRRAGRPCRPSRSARGCGRRRSRSRTARRRHARVSEQLPKSRRPQRARPAPHERGERRAARRPRSGDRRRRTLGARAWTRVLVSALPSRNTTIWLDLGRGAARPAASPSTAARPADRDQQRPSHGDGATASSSTGPPPSERSRSVCDPALQPRLDPEHAARGRAAPAHAQRPALAVDRHAQAPALRRACVRSAPPACRGSAAGRSRRPRSARTTVRPHALAAGGLRFQPRDSVQQAAVAVVDRDQHSGSVTIVVRFSARSDAVMRNW